MRRVAVVVLLPSLQAGLRAAIVRIRIEDTRRADAPATPVAECRLDGIPDTAMRSGRLAVELTFEGPLPAEPLSLFAHLDLDRDGKVSIGDFVTTEHISIPVDLDERTVEVRVTQVVGTRS